MIVLFTAMPDERPLFYGTKPQFDAWWLQTRQPPSLQVGVLMLLGSQAAAEAMASRCSQEFRRPFIHYHDGQGWRLREFVEAGDPIRMSFENELEPNEFVVERVSSDRSAVFTTDGYVFRRPSPFDRNWLVSSMFALETVPHPRGLSAPDRRSRR